MLGSTRDGTCTLLADLFFDLVGGRAGVDGLWFGRLCDDAVEGGGGDELAFASVPLCEDLWAGCAPEDAGVDQAGELDTRDVPGGAVDAREVPDCFSAVEVC